ncbi:hypothetical protein DPMN_135297, partial [Dreissena polymorpha]
YSGRTQRQLAAYVKENFDGKRPQFQRTVSGRIHSRSSSVTPKIPAKSSSHNSADLHNISASSGSHIFDQSQSSSLGHLYGNLGPGGDQTDQHSLSSGSHSLHSAKIEHHGDHGNTKEREQTLEEDAVRAAETAEEKDPESESPKGRTYKFNKRDMSAPLLGAHPADREKKSPERQLSRTAELENIPDTVLEEEDQHVSFSVNSPGLMNGHNHSQTTTTMTTDVDAEEVEEVSQNKPHHSPPPPPVVKVGSPPGRRQITVTPVVPQKAELVEDREATIVMSGDYYPPPPPPLPLSHDSSLVSHDLSFSSPGPASYQSTPRKDMRSNMSGITSNISTLSETRSEGGSEGGDKHRSKKYPVDKAYYIAKELLMTERTYKKDLEVITVWFKNAVKGDDSLPPCVTEMFKNLDPIYNFHVGFLKEVEQRLSMWEGKSNAHLNGDYQRIGDIMVNSFLTSLGPYMNFLEKQDDILMELDKAQRSNREFEFIYKDFESQKVCYLPLNTFLLKPGQRLLHYKVLLERLTRHYPKSHPDYMDCHATLTKLIEMVQMFRSQRKCMENLQKLMELQRDLVGLENLVHPDREFIREGCLQKFSRKGYQQRMFFLFSDMLVYTSRTATQHMQFKVHGQVPLRGMIVEESDHAKMADANSFAIYGGNKCVLVAASSQEEKDKWIEDLNEAVQQAKTRQDDKMASPTLKTSTSSMESHEGENHSPPSPEKQIQHRANTTMHVCWHRNTSVSKGDHEKAIKNQLSGYLLRKFNNSNGWQKLWVVFTNFCLYFYKTYQDDFPLASLPLLGYAVSQSEDEDGIQKDNVFKLQFKNHVYFFRAESQYTFERWMEVINSATSSARRIRLFSRMDSTQP